MSHRWNNLLRAFRRQVVAVIAVFVVLLSSLQINCLPSADSPGNVVMTATQATMTVSNTGTGDPRDPDGCGHCHCVAPSAIIDDHRLVIPAPTVSRTRRFQHLDDAPRGVSFAPDPPPDRA